MKNYQDIVSKFLIEGNVTEVKPLGNGLINDTLLVNTDGTKKYVLQKINNAIFTDVELLQNNIKAVTEHIRTKLVAAGTSDIDRKVLTLVETVDGKTYYCDGTSYWRIMEFIPDSVTYELVDTEYSELCGRAFGEFQSMLADIDKELGETIPDFHNMEFRMKQFMDAIKANPVGRLAEVQELVDALLSRGENMCKAEVLCRAGMLPKRICHCDTKVNNMLFDKNDNSFLCVIDLDTVMPSFVFSDYGDFLRTAANTAPEDEPDLEKISFRKDIFEAFTRGYLSSARSFLTATEIANLPYAVALFPYMQCVRFLTDYINGDTYYKIKYSDHNKVRSYAQFRLLECVENNMEYITNFINLQQ